VEINLRGEGDGGGHREGILRLGRHPAEGENSWGGGSKTKNPRILPLYDESTEGAATKLKETGSKGADWVLEKNDAKMQTMRGKNLKRKKNGFQKREVKSLESSELGRDRFEGNGMDREWWRWAETRQVFLKKS